MANEVVAPPAPKFHDVVIVTTKKYACAKVEGVPPEEVGIDRNARSIADANYFFHDIVTKTEGDWIAEGFDEDQIRSLPSYAGVTNTEILARDTASEHESGFSDLNRSARIVPVTEHYIRMDYEGNGKPDLYMVITGQKDGQVLRKDGQDCVYPIDAIPFAACIPMPVPHRFIGRSLADKTMDVQRIKTALLRGALDNLYLHNAPRPVVSEAHAGPNTIDDILTVRQGAPIRVKQPGGIEWQTVPDITPSVYPMVQYMDSVRESRTGLTKQSQGLDANALQNQSATAVAQVFSESQMQLKLLARNIAEGFKDIFGLLHATIRKHGQQAQTVRLRNQWVNVDPREWKTRDDMTIHVGLGTGSKAQQYAQIMGIANAQKELLMGGKGHMVPDPQLFNTMSELVKLTGHSNPDKFFADPSARDPQTGQLLNPPAPPAPDPKLQVEQMKAQNEQQATQQKGQLALLQSENDAKHQMVKTQAEIALEREKAQLEAELKVVEAKLKQDADAREAALHAQKMQHAEAEHQHKMAALSMQHQQVMEKTQADSYRSAQDHQQRTEIASQQHKAAMEGKEPKEPKNEGPEVIEFVHDKNGRIAGIKKGGRTMVVHRNAQGKMVKVQ